MSRCVGHTVFSGGIVAWKVLCTRQSSVPGLSVCLKWSDREQGFRVEVQVGSCDARLHLGFIADSGLVGLQLWRRIVITESGLYG